MAATPQHDTAMRKYGPLLFSHFFRTLGDEERALRATSGALDRLGALGLSSDLEVVRWVRALKPLTLVRDP
jgi:hypothetical protein